MSGNRRPATFSRRSAKIKNRHREQHGNWCPGASDLEHESHDLKDDEYLTVDHIVPVRDGGSHTAENLRILCNTTNHGRDEIEARNGSKRITGDSVR